MANKSISTMQIQRVLQLLEQGISQREIANQLKISRNTIIHYLLKFKQTGLSYSQLLDLPEADLSELVFNPRISVKHSDLRYQRFESRITYWLTELTKPGVTRLLLWEEYCKQDADSYSYSQFCEHLNVLLRTKDAVMHFEHHPGDKIEVDFAGKQLAYVDFSTGELINTPVFVAVLPYSNYIYAEALENATLPHFLNALNNCLHFFGGVPNTIVSDNMRQFVNRSNRYEPTFNELSQQLAVHYNTSLSATRVRKPRDKAHVEKSVDIVYKRVYALLRNETFGSLRALNHGIRLQLELLNKRTLQKRNQSRHDLWILEKPSLKPLPDEPFEVKTTAICKVQKTYHITIGQDWHHYSVPYQYIGKKVQVVYDTLHVEIYFNHCRIALHKRNYQRHGYTTQADHMPTSHQHQLEAKGWDEQYFITQSQQVGPATEQVIRQVISSRFFTQQTYNACLGILRLKNKYTKERLENACKRALTGAVVNYKTISSILATSMDKQEEINFTDIQIPAHENIRGASEYDHL